MKVSEWEVADILILVGIFVGVNLAVHFIIKKIEA